MKLLQTDPRRVVQLCAKLKTSLDNRMNARPYRVLFVCTGNSARSILAEAILQQEGEGKFQSFSAGSQPKGVPHPLAIELLQQQGYQTEQFRSKSWEEFSGRSAPKMDFIITVCNNAANETCPVWPGHPASAHWGLPDPAAVTGSTDMQRAAFKDCYRMLSERIRMFVGLPLKDMDPGLVRQRLDEIGRLQGAGD